MNTCEESRTETGNIPVTSAASSIGIIAQQEYATQFFGFTPKSLTDGLYNAVVEYVSEGLGSLSKVMMCKHSGMSEAETHEACESFREELQPDFSKAFDKLENIFKIPPDVLLKEDQLWNEYSSASPAAVEKSNEEIEIRKKKIIGTRYVGARLRQELADTEPEVENLRRIIAEQTSMFSLCQKIYDDRELLTELVDGVSELALE